LSTCSIFFHNYYGQHEKWIKYFSEKVNTPFNLYYNIVENSIYNLEADKRISDRLNNLKSGNFLNKIILRISPNQGKDIGGKLVLIDAYLRGLEESEYIIFIHDKKSPQSVQSIEWQKKLFQIIEPSFVEKALTIFSKNKSVGIIAEESTISNEFDYTTNSFSSNNLSRLKNLQTDFNVTPADYHYVAGTMFWARSLPLMRFFREHPPLNIRMTLEKGNILDETEGSYTHAWERMLSWLIIAQEYTIKGI
jgi:lipopolysaccharide biosynthesis protein